MGRGGATTSVRGYRSKISLDFQSIDFCSLVQPRILNVRKTAASVPEMDCSLEVNFENKTLLAWFPLEAKSSKGTYIKAYRFIADLANLKVFHKCHGAENEFALVVPMPFPPKYWWSTESKALKVGENSSRKLRKAPKESWFRATNMEPDCDSVMMYPVASSSEAHDSDFSEIGRWTTFRFFFREPREDTKSLLREMSLGLEDLNIDMKLCDNFKLQYGQHQTMWTFLDRPANASDTAKFLLDAVHLPFEVRYQLEVCVSSGIVNEHNVSEAFLRQLAEMEPKAARLILENIADSGRPITDPLSLFHNSETKSYITPGVIPTSSAMVRKIFITPTTIKLNTPVSEVSNRVVRKFSHNQDRFLRVQFTEESGRGLPSMSRKQDEEITRRVLRALHQGIRIGDRVYHFLAYGNSQLRERGAYFFAPTNNVSCDDIRGWLGSFDHIRIVAKYAARIGQCFSTSREVQGIRVPVICNVPDIGKDGHCFTDGVGMVSELLTSIISGEFCLDASIPSSAFQFRMGGCKGMLVKWPLKARGKEVHIRKSQEKFPADSKTLEILRCARFATATLNRQTIVILECLGVPPSAFMNLLQIQLKAFDEAMIDSARAAKLLLRFVDDNHITPVLAKLLEAGFKTESGLREPFVVNAIALWRLWSLKQLKEKARIHVEKSVFLLGCVDETKTLRGHHKVTEGSCDKDLGLLPEIFVQMTGFEGGQETRIYEGVCIVGRNPSLHPGDIRVVCAVDVPELHHLKDVVVFPRIGDRPVPNMLAGGDLDGDDFFVIWDPKLIPKEWNHPPMDYQAPEPDELDRDVRVDDLKNFFVKYMQNDFLALIAISHLALADKEGPKSRRCKFLNSIGTSIS